jgi:hypothetical protein
MNPTPALPDLGLNSDSIAFEVALEALGQSKQPFMQAIALEREKTAPSDAFIRYCKARLAAIDELQEDLHPTDMDTVRRIVGRDPLFTVSEPSQPESEVGFTMKRIEAALAGTLDPGLLSEDELRIYDDALIDSFATPSPQAIAFFAERKNKPGSVGYDDQGRLVRTKADGTDEVIG